MTCDLGEMYALSLSVLREQVQSMDRRDNEFIERMSRRMDNERTRMDAERCLLESRIAQVCCVCISLQISLLVRAVVVKNVCKVVENVYHLRRLKSNFCRQNGSLRGLCQQKVDLKSIL